MSTPDPNNTLRRIFLCTLLLASTLWACGADPSDPNNTPSDNKTPLVLVDLYHARKQNHVDYRLEKGNYNYQGTFGYYRAFAHLQAHGYKVEVLRNKPLTSVDLTKYHVLFINLLHEDRPNFTSAEITQLQTFVRDGGGLFLIADHTNVYRHAERLNPILQPMGVEILYSTITDQAPYIVEGMGWIKVTDFRKHPITEGLQSISLQTGTAFHTQHGIAFTSTFSFADFWDENDPNGFYGDWSFNGDTKREPKGPLPVVAARSYGKGRLVIVGDQNIFGDTWLHFANNFSLFMNAFSWSAKRENITPALRDQTPSGLQIHVDITHNTHRTGRTSPEDYYSFYAHLNRDTQVTARARPTPHPKSHTLIFPQPTSSFSSQELDSLHSMLHTQGKTIVLLLETPQISPAIAQLLFRLDPTVSLSVNDQIFNLTKPDQITKLQALPIPQRQGFFPLSSSSLEVSQLKLASLRWNIADQRGKDPYLLDVQSSWGQPLVQANTNQKPIDIARVRQVGKGRLIVFFQDGFWRNRTLGPRSTTPPHNNNQHAISFLYALLDYLKQN